MPKALTCECVIGYHTVRKPDGTYRQELDAGCDIPNIMELCFGTCYKCGLPYFDQAELGGPNAHLLEDRVEPLYDAAR